VPIVLSDTFPVRCPNGKGLNLKDSGLLDEAVSPGVVRSSSAPANRPAHRPVIVTMPAVANVELPEISAIAPNVHLAEPAEARPIKPEPPPTPPVTPAAVEPPTPMTEVRQEDPLPSTIHDARLNKVVTAWPILPPTVQSTILALVRASVGK
jgi:hypothetical protein